MAKRMITETRSYDSPGSPVFCYHGQPVMTVLSVASALRYIGGLFWSPGPYSSSPVKFGVCGALICSRCGRSPAARCYK